jgi:hypothetical protein
MRSSRSLAGVLYALSAALDPRSHMARRIKIEGNYVARSTQSVAMHARSSIFLRLYGSASHMLLRALRTSISRSRAWRSGFRTTPVRDDGWRSYTNGQTKKVENDEVHVLGIPYVRRRCGRRQAASRFLARRRRPVAAITALVLLLISSTGLLVARAPRQSPLMYTLD